MRLVKALAQPLTDDGWAPFGWLPVADTDPRDSLQHLHFEWADPNLNVIAHAYDEVDHTAEGAVCAVMFRHDTHTQALMPLNVPAVVAVARASLDFSSPWHLDLVQAFVLQPLEVFVLFRGTWHWGPFPLGPESVQLLNVQGVRYAEDNASVDLAARAGAAVEVVVPA